MGGSRHIGQRVRGLLTIIGLVTLLVTALLLYRTWPSSGHSTAQLPLSLARRVGEVRDIPKALYQVATPVRGKPTSVAPTVLNQPSRGLRLRPTADHRLDTPPSTDVSTINRVLEQYGSPALGKGQAFYDLGVLYGIDPAYSLAFYVHESTCGTKGVARFTHSIGNIRTTPGYADFEGYRSYTTFEAGIEDWYKLIKELYMQDWGLRTVAAIVPRYAPWGDNNNPDIYIHTVESLVDSWGP